jgi:hypothetical protein
MNILNQNFQFSGLQLIVNGSAEAVLHTEHWPENANGWM